MDPDSSTKTLQKIALHIRENIIRMLLKAGSGHSAGPLGMADIFAALYFSVLHHDPSNPHWKERDRLVLSAGHLCPVLYATLAEAGYFPESRLLTLRQFSSPLQGHPNRLELAGVENSSGPLGQGISQAIGMALALRVDQPKAHVYCVMSDGEHNEGQVWEANLFAAKEKLKNLTVIVDRNHIQIDGFTEKVMPLEPLFEKYESFGFMVYEIDGHNLDEIVEMLQAVRHIDRPSCIIAHTIPGKGIGFMEDRFEWHGKTPTEEQAYAAIEQLRSLENQIEKPD